MKISFYFIFAILLTIPTILTNGYSIAGGDSGWALLQEYRININNLSYIENRDNIPYINIEQPIARTFLLNLFEYLCPNYSFQILKVILLLISFYSFYKLSLVNPIGDFKDIFIIFLYYFHPGFWIGDNRYLLTTEYILLYLTLPILYYVNLKFYSSDYLKKIYYIIIISLLSSILVSHNYAILVPVFCIQVFILINCIGKNENLFLMNLLFFIISSFAFYVNWLHILFGYYLSWKFDNLNELINIYRNNSRISISNINDFILLIPKSGDILSNNIRIMSGNLIGLLFSIMALKYFFQYKKFSNLELIFIIFILIISNFYNSFWNILGEIKLLLPLFMSFRDSFTKLFPAILLIITVVILTSKNIKLKFYPIVLLIIIWNFTTIKYEDARSFLINFDKKQITEMRNILNGDSTLILYPSADHYKLSNNIVQTYNGSYAPVVYVFNNHLMSLTNGRIFGQGISEKSDFPYVIDNFCSIYNSINLSKPNYILVPGDEAWMLRKLQNLVTDEMNIGRELLLEHSEAIYNNNNYILLQLKNDFLNNFDYLNCEKYVDFKYDSEYWKEKFNNKYLVLNSLNCDFILYINLYYNFLLLSLLPIIFIFIKIKNASIKN